MSATPWGAAPQDTAEYMLGKIVVTPVLLESNGSIDVSSEDWTPQLIQQIKSTVVEGVEWWKTTLANYTSVHSLDFEFDFRFADQPVPTAYEPIARMSNDYPLWVNEFLTFAGFNTSASIDQDIRQFNHAQRTAYNADWAFTIFVVNSTNDVNDEFLEGGSFSRAFAFAGGRYIISPSGRPASTFAHETGHIFWAKDEYLGGGNYTDHRGYYDTQNWNAANNTTPGFVQQPSIMASGTALNTAYANHVSAQSTLEMIGWRDSDHDGIFDVLDVPHTLEGVGYFDAAANRYRFVGHAEVGTLPNRNSSGLQNDITINRITRAEYRIDGGPWLSAAGYDSPVAELDLSLLVPSGDHEIEIRTTTLDPGTGKLVAWSPSFVGRTTLVQAAPDTGLQGFVFNDLDGDLIWDNREIALVDRIVRVVDGAGQPVTLQQGVEPDQFNDASQLNNLLTDVSFSASGNSVSSSSVISRVGQGSTGQRVFAYVGVTGHPRFGWVKDGAELRIDFSVGQSFVSIDAIATSGTAAARLEAYDDRDNLLERYNSPTIASGQLATLSIGRAAGDIAYVKVMGRTGTPVNLDNLRYGPATVAHTGPLGQFSLPDLPDGSYVLETIVSPGETVLTPPLLMVAGGAAANVQFAVQDTFPWRNPNNHQDIDNNGRVTAFDVVLLLAEIIANGTRSLPSISETVGPPYFWDASGDNSLSPLDVLSVMAKLMLTGGGEDSVPIAPAPAPAGPPALAAADASAADPDAGPPELLAPSQSTLATSLGGDGPPATATTPAVPSNRPPNPAPPDTKAPSAADASTNTNSTAAGAHARALEQVLAEGLLGIDGLLGTSAMPRPVLPDRQSTQRAEPLEVDTHRALLDPPRPVLLQPRRQVATVIDMRPAPRRERVEAGAVPADDQLLATTAEFATSLTDPLRAAGFCRAAGSSET